VIVVLEMILFGAFLVAASPLAVVAEIVFVTDGGLTRAVSFVAGWCTVLLIICVAGLGAGGGRDYSSGSTPTTVVSWLQLIAGIGLLGWVAWRIAARRRAPADPPPPKWLAGAARLRPVGAFALGAFLPTYAIALAAVSEVVRADLAAGASIVACLVFVATATLLMAAPVLVVRSGGESSGPRLDAWRTWLHHHASDLTTGLLGLIGVVLCVRGITGLL
jgi:hypothetical protein